MKQIIIAGALALLGSAALAQGNQSDANRCETAGQNVADSAYCVDQLRDQQRREAMRQLRLEQSQQRLQDAQQRDQLNRNTFTLQQPSALAPPTIPGIVRPR